MHRKLINTHDENKVRDVTHTSRPWLAILFSIVRYVLGGDRFKNLYNEIELQILALQIKDAILIDYGCGSRIFSNRLLDNGVIKYAHCIDTYDLADNLTCNEKYYKVGSDAYFAEYQADVAILIDVLHHVEHNEIFEILDYLKNRCEYIIVKDHIEHGFISRHLLRLADYFGNSAYGVSIPNKYFTHSSFNKIIGASNLKIIKISENIRVHRGIFGLIIPPSYHFIALLGKPNATK